MKNPRILIVDDDLDFSDAIRTALENHKFQVLSAADGEEGLQKAREEKPNLIILDVMLPKQDGYSVCHQLKEDKDTSHIPVLMLTSLGKQREGKSGPEILAKGHRADGYLEKPVEPDILVKTAKELLKKAEEAPEIQKTRVLLVDDDPDFIAAVKTLLEENDYEVKIAYTGEDGLLLARKENPDIVLLDVMLPEKDGFAVCKELKEDDRTRNIPIIILTSVGKKMTEPDYAKAMAITHQADDYIEKPVDTSELLKRIRKRVGPMRRLV
jgi:DNA-binding response OmpR family regulator